jgi:hypothetical protein
MARAIAKAIKNAKSAYGYLGYADLAAKMAKKGR